MTNKRTVERYIDGFRKSDHEQILSCLTDDVEWDIPGMFHTDARWKDQAFDFVSDGAQVIVSRLAAV